MVGRGPSTGKFGVHLAALAAIVQIIVVAGSRSATGLQSFGATHIIDRIVSPQDIVDQIRASTQGDLLYAYDIVNLAEDKFLGVDAFSTT